MNLIVAVAIVLLDLYVAYGISCQIPHVVLSIRAITSFRYSLGFTSCALQVANMEQITDILTAAS